MRKNIGLMSSANPKNKLRKIRIMDALENIINRQSSRFLDEPIPDREQLHKIYQAALRAPDHANLKPSHFIEVSGIGLRTLSDVFVTYAKKHIENISAEKLEKYKKAPFRAPLIIILVCETQSHKMVPPLEQLLSTAAAGQNILLALNAMNFAAIWRTGVFAFNPKIGSMLGLTKDQQIIGYLYIGTSKEKKREISDIDINDYVRKLKKL